MSRSRWPAGREHAHWLQAGYDAAEARFLMLTAITHHRFGSRAWGADAVRSLHAELGEIEAAATHAFGSGPWPGAGLGR